MNFMALGRRLSLPGRAAIALLFFAVVSAHANILSDAEIFPLAARAEPETLGEWGGAQHSANTHPRRPLRAQVQRPARVALDSLPAARLAQSLAQAPRPPGPLQIGLSRPVLILRGFSETAALLAWQNTAQGGKIAAISLVSPDALGLRLGLLVEKLPAAAILRFYAQGDDTAVEVSAQTVLDMIAANRQAGDDSDAGRTYWSPVVEGITSVMEIELPAGVDTQSVKIALPQVSHLFAPLHSRLASERASGACNLDVTCQAAWGDASNAVARMLFTSGGGSYLCSGTLLSDKDLSTSIPYFLSANHCISSQTEASSLTTYWFYRASACNSGTPYSAAQPLSGGAALLYANASTDTSFMRLNNKPPAGALFAGWDSMLPATGSAVTGIHHPSGDLQKISFGTLNAYESCASSGSGYYDCSPALAAAADHYSIIWRSGITEGGSSGSALFLDTHYLIGTLHGGLSYCSAPHEPDDYGRFDRAFSAALYQWLNKTDLLITLSGAGSGTVSSVPDGIRCGTDCSESYYRNESIMLSATPASGSSFAGWSGACSGLSSRCTLAMNTAQAVSARFNLATVPASPVITSVARATTSAMIRFSLASDGGFPVNAYFATCTAPGQPAATGSGTASPIIVSRLVRNVAYRCSLVAHNAAGASVASSVFTVAAKPANLTPILLLLLD